VALRDLSPGVRAPILGFGLGAVAGGFEAIKLAATLKLSPSFLQALELGLVAVAADAVLGLVFALPVGLAVQLLTRRMMASRRHALGMAATAALLGWWFLVPAARTLLDEHRTAAALAFAVAPFGIGGVVWFNAGYWLRREEIGEDRRLGWSLASLVGALGLALGAAGTLATRTFGGAQALEGDPAVILITIDTLRRDCVSAYYDDKSQAPVQTPTLDRLASQGILFTDAITPFPETAPAHSAMMTGLHPFRTGMLSNGHHLASGYKTLAETLSGEGYATAAFVSSFAVDSRTGLDQGFEVYDDELMPWVRGVSEILAARLATRLLLHFGDPLRFDFLLERPSPVTYDLALDWLQDNGDKPFFLWVHTFDVHSPYEPHGMPGFEDNGTPGHPSIDHRWILAHEDQFTYDADAQAKLRRLYAEEVAYTDQQLGLFIDRVQALKLDRPVLLIVAGDHGEMLGEHGIEMNHHGVYEQAVRIPLIIDPIKVSGPKRVVGEQVRLMDLPATVLGQLGLDPKAMGKTEGINLLHFVDLPDQMGATTMVMGRRSASLSQGTLFALRANARKVPTPPESGRPGETLPPVNPKRGRIKYILDPDAGTEALYDLDADPLEQQDEAVQQPQVVEQLRARVVQEAGLKASEGPGGLHFQAGADAAVAPSIDAAAQERLKALGYVDQ